MEMSMTECDPYADCRNVNTCCKVKLACASHLSGSVLHCTKINRIACILLSVQRVSCASASRICPNPLTPQMMRGNLSLACSSSLAKMFPAKQRTSRGFETSGTTPRLCLPLSLVRQIHVSLHARWWRDLLDLLSAARPCVRLVRAKP